MNNDAPASAERNNLSQDDWNDVRASLADANGEGQLVSIVFTLQHPTGATMVDYRGSREVTEIACRKVRDRIATEIAETHPLIAERIRQTNRGH